MDKSEENAIRALAYISTCDDAQKLQILIENARKSEQHTVCYAAQLRLYDILPSARPGSLEHDVWRSIFALEGALKEERGKTILLSRTRQKIRRDGENKTVSDLVSGKVSDGFVMLLERKMPRLTFEAVALRHSDKFPAEILDAAESRLRDYDLDPSTLV